ncbi:MAG: hypothetical protein QNK37_20615 [Acidobacteriota bacterium]|nr:hypothetical protein [Acidobacteriota bacterium]
MNLEDIPRIQTTPMRTVIRDRSKELSDFLENIGSTRNVKNMTTAAYRFATANAHRLNQVGLTLMKRAFLVFDPELFISAFKKDLGSFRPWPVDPNTGTEVKRLISFVFYAEPGFYLWSEIWSRLGEELSGEAKEHALRHRMKAGKTELSTRKIKRRWCLVVSDPPGGLNCGLRWLCRTERIPFYYQAVVNDPQLVETLSSHALWPLFEENCK